MARIRIAAPETASRGEVIELKALIQHPMESGFRPDARGGRIPRNIITEFVCLYDGAEIFRADFFPAVAANPFLTFYAKADKTGDLEFRWIDQHGEISSETVRLTVS